MKKIDLNKETKIVTYMLTYTNINFIKENAGKKNISMSKYLNELIVNIRKGDKK